VSEHGERPQPRPHPRPRPRKDEPVLPEQPRDETDAAWGDAPGERDEQWYRRERPPHHD